MYRLEDDLPRPLNSAGNRRGMHPNSRRALDRHRADPRVVEAGLANLELGRLSEPQALRRLGWRKRTDPEVARFMCQWRSEHAGEIDRLLDRMLGIALADGGCERASLRDQVAAGLILSRHVWRTDL